MSIASLAVRSGVGPGSTIAGIITRGLLGGAPAPVVVPERFAGGWLTVPDRRRTADDIRRDRVRFGVLPDVARQIARQTQQDIAALNQRIADAQDAAALAEAQSLALVAQIAAQEAAQALSRRQRRLMQQRLNALQIKAQHIADTLRALALRQEALRVQAEELDVVYVAAVLATL